METNDEFDVTDYMRLMRDFLDRRIEAHQYVRSYFELTVKRVNIPNEEVNRITQQGYGDADDYEPDITIRPPNWIGESELRDRVAKSLRELAALGFRLEDDRSDKPR
jgi:Bacterial self-protective colicin-like immunity